MLTTETNQIGKVEDVAIVYWLVKHFAFFYSPSIQTIIRPKRVIMLSKSIKKIMSTVSDNFTEQSEKFLGFKKIQAGLVS